MSDIARPVQVRQLKTRGPGAGRAQTDERGNAMLSVVIAAFNEEDVIRALYARLKAVLSSLPYRHELVFVDDGSTDATAERLASLSDDDPLVRVLQLSRNFGKEAAISAGIAHAAGDAVILIDADLEHPPEVIPRLVAEWEAGAEVVIGVRNPHAGEGFFRRVASRAFAHIMNMISEVPSPARATDFRLIDRAVADEFTRFVESRRLTRSLIDWLGFRRAYVAFDAGVRDGKSRYGYGRLIGSALAAIVAHSRAPLYVAGYLGAGITLAAFFLGVFVLIEQFGLRDPMHLEVSGTAMLSIMTLFLSGILLGCLGLMGLYIGTIREEIAGRPLYIIRPARARPRVDNPAQETSAAGE